MHSPQTLETKNSLRSNLRHGPRWYKITFNKTQDTFDNTNYLLFIDDITPQKQRLQESEYAASHDQLTGLINRAAAREQIERWIDEPAGNHNIVLMMLDLDGFKPVNDSLGHDAGDEILKVISARLRAHTRATDLVARWGGDEFLVALTSIDASAAEHIGNKLIDVISQPILYRQETLRVGASVGIAVAEAHSAKFKELFDTADRAMYHVKRNGKNGVELMSA